jgi:hypothetical protein
VRTFPRSLAQHYASFGEARRRQINHAVTIRQA